MNKSRGVIVVLLCLVLVCLLFAWYSFSNKPITMRTTVIEEGDSLEIIIKNKSGKNIVVTSQKLIEVAKEGIYVNVFSNEENFPSPITEEIIKNGESYTEKIYIKNSAYWEKMESGHYRMTRRYYYEGETDENFISAKFRIP